MKTPLIVTPSYHTKHPGATDGRYDSRTSKACSLSAAVHHRPLELHLALHELTHSLILLKPLALHANFIVANATFGRLLPHSGFVRHLPLLGKSALRANFIVANPTFSRLLPHSGIVHSALVFPNNVLLLHDVSLLSLNDPISGVVPVIVDGQFARSVSLPRVISFIDSKIASTVSVSYIPGDTGR